MEDSKETDCVYQIPCKSCNHICHVYVMYVSKTGRTYGTRLEEHKKLKTSQPDDLPGKRRESAVTEHKSAITDLANRNNCIIDWDRAKVIDIEHNRWIKEALWQLQS